MPRDGEAGGRYGAYPRREASSYSHLRRWRQKNGREADWDASSHGSSSTIWCGRSHAGPWRRRWAYRTFDSRRSVATRTFPFPALVIGPSTRTARRPPDRPVAGQHLMNEQLPGSPVASIAGLRSTLHSRLTQNSRSRTAKPAGAQLLAIRTRIPPRRQPAADALGPA